MYRDPSAMTVGGSQPHVSFVSLHVAGLSHGFPGDTHPSVVLQTSAPLQNVPSLHTALFGAFKHNPVVRTHVSVVQEMPSLQSAFVIHSAQRSRPSSQSCPGHRSPVPTQAPFEHASVAVQNAPSLHASVLLMLKHEPAMHRSSVQPLLSVGQSAFKMQSTHASVLSLHSCPGHGAPDPTQLPPEQTSVAVQNNPSLHASVLLVNTHVPVVVLQVSVVQNLPSLQFPLVRHCTQRSPASSHNCPPVHGAPVPTQTPPEHVSVVVQNNPSLHDSALLG